MEEKIIILLAIVILIAIIVYIALLVAVYKSAKSRDRGAFSWTFFAFFFTPLLCLFILLVLGETKEKHEERVVEEERIRMRVNGKRSVEDELDKLMTSLQSEALSGKPLKFEHIKKKVETLVGKEVSDDYVKDLFLRH